MRISRTKARPWTFTETPQIGTTATVNGQHTADPSGEITIVDVVEYSGLNPGKTYTLRGTIIDKSTQQPLLVEENPVTAGTEFNPRNCRWHRRGHLYPGRLQPGGQVPGGF